MPVLDRNTLEDLQKAVEYIKDSQKELGGLIFFSHKEKAFLAGADLNLIDQMTTQALAEEGAEVGQRVFNAIEDLEIPTVCCVHGPCLGGGLEMALSCRTILASDDPKTILGAPEVKLGLIPGFGGTYRIPRRVGLPSALGLILSGRPVGARRARAMGLVDELYPKEQLLMGALRHLARAQAGRSPKRGWRERLLRWPGKSSLARRVIFQRARENVLKKTRGFYHAPLKILEAMEKGMNQQGRRGHLLKEAQAFGELCISEQSLNLRRVFFLSERAKKAGPPGGGTLRRGAVVGAGAMGGGIAWLMSSRGMAPIMKDLNFKALDAGLAWAQGASWGELLRKKIKKEEFQRRQYSIRGQTSYQGLGAADLVVEAVVEDLEVKQKVLSEVEQHIKKEAILTSNTSSLSIEAMARTLKHPERFAGLHFFNPVNRMPLVEIVGHSKTSPETLATLYRWALGAKKTPLIVKDGPGFVVNRILMPFFNEAMYLLEEGQEMNKIDEACCNFGMPMGPLRLMDEVGLDVGAKVAGVISLAVGERLSPSPLLEKLREKKLLGRKGGEGLYTYGPKGPSGPGKVLRGLLPRKKSRALGEVEIQKRVFLPMINEAGAILEEGLVDEAWKVDLGLIFGLGFPPFRGGLLRYADSEGLERINQALGEYEQSVSPQRYRPVAMVKKLAEQKGRFYNGD